MPRLKKIIPFVRRLAIAYTFICLFLWFGQERLLFWPSRVIKKTPSFYNLNYQNVRLPVSTKDGKIEIIHGWWIPASNPQAPIILYFHHNAINIGANVSQAEDFHKLGYSVLLIDYRGFGQSEGNFPTESQVYQDAEAAWNYLINTRKISPKQIIIYGHSLGAAIAIDIAVKHPEAAGLIVQNSFTNLRDMTKRFGLFWILPIDLLLRQRFDSLKKISFLKIPVLFIHGVRDPQIPAKMSQTLFAATPAPKRLLLIAEGGHDNNMDKPDLQKVGKFVEDVMNGKTKNEEVIYEKGFLPLSK
ncbi:alpha/beta hydrolase [Aerosakkonema funiforme]|uniref:alpha/beta hydrolase n=1 Tax=Aerosakkonema funiforme TaxID=1246630 RepID=UPI0035B7011B